MVTAIEQQYIDTHPGSAERHATARGLFPDGVTHDTRRLKPFPIYATHGLGPHKWDVDGNRLIDYYTGHGSLILGHSHPDIVEAVTTQMARGTHLSASTDLEIRWGQAVVDLVPCAEKVRFQSSGTEATLMAFRMVRAYTGKTKIIKFEDHFHGWHDYAMAGNSVLGGIPEETLSTMIVLPPNDISLVERTLSQDDDVAAVILEPTGSHMGHHAVTPEFVLGLREVTERYGAALIFDEVVTGFRTSKGGAQEYYGIMPDMCTMAKILGGGLPGGAVAGRAEIINMIEMTGDPEHDSRRRVQHNGTFNANPLSAAAGIKALELVANTPVNDTANAMAARLKDGLNDMLSRSEVPGCASGVASAIFLRLGVDHECDRSVCILSPEDTAVIDDAERKNQLELAMMNHGVHSGNRFIVMSVHTEEDIDLTVEAAERSVNDLRKQGLV